jgi:C1A family cysteine protease
MESRKRGMGWLPDYPDIRDYSFENKELLSKKEIHSLVTPVGLLKAQRTTLPSSVDLRRWCPPVEDQGGIGSCTAHAGVGMVEYYEKALPVQGHKEPIRTAWRQRRVDPFHDGGPRPVRRPA